MRTLRELNQVRPDADCRHELDKTTSTPFLMLSANA